MKIFKTSLLVFSLLFIVCAVKAQDVDGEAADFAILKGEKSINIEFNYDKVAVGDYSKESEYVKHKTDDMNSKEKGTGDDWAKRWYEAREEHYKPKFLENFIKQSDLTIDTAAKYTLIFKVSFIEPGYQIAISKKASQVEGQIYLVATANKTKKLATVTVDRGGGYFRGGAFDFATRIAEAFAVTGKKLGVLIKKGMK